MIFFSKKCKIGISQSIQSWHISFIENSALDLKISSWIFHYLNPAKEIKKYNQFISLVSCSDFLVEIVNVENILKIAQDFFPFPFHYSNYRLSIKSRNIRWMPSRVNYRDCRALIWWYGEWSLWQSGKKFQTFDSHIQS